MNTDSSLHLILKSNPLKHLMYPMKSNHSLGNLTFLSIESDVPGNKHPTIYQNNHTFIKTDRSMFILAQNLELHIKFVDLENIQLFTTNNKRQQKQMKLTLGIKNSTIQSHTEMDAFVKADLDSGSKVIFSGCSLNLKVGRIHIKMFKNSKSVFVFQECTIIRSMEIVLQNVSKAIIKRCNFYNIKTPYSLLSFYGSNVLIKSSTVKTSWLLDFLNAYNSILTINSFVLSSIKLYTTSGRLIYLYNSTGHVNNVSLKDVQLRSSLLRTDKSNIFIKDLKIEKCLFTFGINIGGYAMIENITVSESMAYVIFQINGFATFTNILIKKTNIETVLIQGITSNSNLTIKNSNFQNNSATAMLQTEEKSFIQLSYNNFTGNIVNDLITTQKSTIKINHNLVQRNIIKKSILQVTESEVSIIGITIASNQFKVFVNGISKSKVTLTKVNYLLNNATGEGQFARIVNSELHLIGINIASENPSSSMLHLTSSSISSWNSSIDIKNAKSSQIQLLRWNIKRLDTRNNPCIIKMSCPQNFYFVEKTGQGSNDLGYDVSCKACSKGTFTMKAGQMSIMKRNVKEVTKHYLVGVGTDSEVTGFKTKKSVPICKPCPPGGRCETIIRSRKNFYGYSRHENDLEFILCPAGYCCSSEDQCQTIKDCQKERIGRLCGKCKDGYQISYATNKCFRETLCTPTKRKLFWIYFCSLPMIIAFVLSFAKVIKETAGKAFKKLKDSMKKICCCCRSKYKDEEPQTESSCNTDGEQNFSLSAIFSILVSFYQIKSLVKIDSSSSGKYFIDDILNLRFFMIEKLETYCPFINLDTVTKEILRGFGNPIVMILTLVVILIFCRCYKVRHRFSSCFIVGFFIVLSFCFKDLSNVSLNLVNCVDVEDAKILYISGDVLCFARHWWQYTVACFIGIWIVPFPLGMVLCYYLIRRDKISTTTYLLCLAFPIIVPIVFVFRMTSNSDSQESLVFDENAKSHLKEILEDPYKESFWWWEVWRIVEKLIFNTLAVFIHDVLTRIYVMTVVLIVLTYIHFRLNPYKKKMFILYRMDILSFICLFFHLEMNLIRAFVIVYGSPVKDTFDFYLESVLTQLWYLPIYFLIKKVTMKITERKKDK